MIRLVIALLLLHLASLAYGQPIDPRVRIRVIGDNDIGGQNLGNELSSTVYVDEVGSEQKGQLDRIHQFLKNQQWPETADMLVRLSESDLSKLVEVESNDVSVNGSSNEVIRLSPLSHVVNLLIGNLAARAPETLLAYRDRVDPLARRWLRQARIERDPQQLEQLVQEAFHSSYGDDALLQLGDWALERGAFDEARRSYRAIHGTLAWKSNRKRLPYWLRSLRGEMPSALAAELTAREHGATDANRVSYIDSAIPIAEVWGRMVLASILQGSPKRAAAELAILKQAWPDATGIVGGQQGTLAELLSNQLASSRAWPRNDQQTNWTTFAGNFARNSSSAIEIDISLEPAWKQPLSQLEADNDAKKQQAVRSRFGLPTEASGELTDQPCSYFPIVFDGLVVFKDQAQLFCLDLQTGTPAWSTNKNGLFFKQTNTITTPAVTFGGRNNIQLGQLRFTLSYANQLITATAGSQLSGSATNSTLIGFDIKRQGAIQFGPIRVENSQWAFHGAPIHDANRCWVGIRLRDTSAQDFLACFDVHTGEELWQTRISTAETLGGNAIETTCNFLLTKHEDTIYVSSHLGSIAAVTAQSGRIRWTTKYPRRGATTKNLTDQSWHTLRDLTPCVVHNDLLIAAPSDSYQVFALHKESGELIWSTTVATDAIKILGVSEDGQLIMSGRRLWWLDVYTGQPSHRVSVNPFPANVGSEPTGAGRGLLSAGNVYWPAIEDGKSKIYVLRQSDGKPARQPIDLDERGVQAGNLVVVPGYLLIAAPEELAVFKLDSTTQGLE